MPSGLDIEDRPAPPRAVSAGAGAGAAAGVRTVRPAAQPQLLVRHPHPERRAAQQRVRRPAVSGGGRSERCQRSRGRRRGTGGAGGEAGALGGGPDRGVAGVAAQRAPALRAAGGREGGPISHPDRQQLGSVASARVWGG